MISLYTQVCFRILLLLAAGSVSAQNWQSLYTKSDSLANAGNFIEASLIAKQALDLGEQTFGKQHINYARTLSLLGNVLTDRGDYAIAETYLIGSRDLFRQLDSTRTDDYISLLDGLGSLYRIRGNYPYAENSLKEALAIRDQMGQQETVGYANTLGRLGGVYFTYQAYKKAELLLVQALNLYATLLGKKNSSYPNILNSLGLVYLNLEDYTRSELYFREAIPIWESVLGPEHPSVGAIVGNLGFLKLNQGAYEAALPLLNRAATIQAKKAPGSLNHIVVLTNIAFGYTRTKRYNIADSLYTQALEITASKLGKEHPQYANILNNIAFVAEARGQYARAENLYRKGLLLYKEKIGEETMGAAEMISNIASAYAGMNEQKKADSLYQKAIAIMKRQIGTNSLRYAGTLDHYATLLIQKNQIDSAAVATATVQSVIRQNLNRNFLYQTARQKESLLNKWGPFVQSSFALAQRYPQRSDAAQLAYSGTLFLKNLLLSQYIGLLGNETQTADAKLQLLTDTLRQVSNQVAAQYALPIAQRKNLDSLETRAETLEKDLARQSAPFRQAQQALQVTWENVRDALKPTEAAVEFVSFPHLNRGQETDTVRYLALVLRPGDKAPRVVPLLTDEAPLRRLLARRKGATLYATRGSELDSDQLSRGDSLYQLVWQPIDSLLSGVKTVYLSPSGLLHQVAFTALPYPNANQKDDSFLADRYQLRQVGSTRQVAQPNPADDTYQRLTSAQLYGGIQYDSAGTVPARTGGWPFLPGTAREVSEISAFIGAKATTTTGAAATETEFKKQSGHSPAVLHVATHGFVFPDPAVSTPDSSAGGWAFQRIANPLFRTGLLMAGANRVWQGGRPPLGEDDGILTAYEVANLNLTGTKLVVLSACETALGDIRGSEGVFGLQRAFKMAGAGYLLTSLWPVSDETTGTLMTQFYRNWKKYKTIRTAFQQTQQQMRQKYPPSVWAAFVLIE